MSLFISVLIVGPVKYTFWRGYAKNPKDVYGEDFPSKTFRVLKEKEIKQFGEYRTKWLVLEAWTEMERSGK